jgi:hypothetical protein
VMNGAQLLFALRHSSGPMTGPPAACLPPPQKL